MTRLKGLFATTLLAVVALTGCVSAPSVTATDAGSPAASPAATGSTPSAPAVTCTDAQTYASYAPDAAAGPDRSGSYANTVRQRGYLVAGVSADTLLLGVADAANPTQFDGFDIEMVRAVARALWPQDKTTIDSRIRFKVITAGDRTPQLKLDVKPEISAGGVDLVARVFTITCARWKDVAFSAPYLAVTKRLLVAGQVDPAKYVVPSGMRICAPTGTTSIEGIDKINNGKAVGVPLHTDCLALLQQGKVDAITGDDVILAGFHAQDPYTTVLPTAYTGQQFAGLGINKAHPDFVRFVNGVLEQFRADSGWQTAYKTWLQDKGGLPAQTLPAPLYGRGA